jgi:hypothetical protein
MSSGRHRKMLSTLSLGAAAVALTGIAEAAMPGAAEAGYPYARDRCTYPGSSAETANGRHNTVYNTWFVSVGCRGGANTDASGCGHFFISSGNGNGESSTRLQCGMGSHTSHINVGGSDAYAAARVCRSCYYHASHPHYLWAYVSPSR